MFFKKSLRQVEKSDLGQFILVFFNKAGIE